MEEGKVLMLLLLLLLELITGTMGAADNSMPNASTLQGAEPSSQAPPFTPSLPSATDSASLAASPSTLSSSSSSSSGSNSLVCWSCSSSSHGNPCYNIDPDNATSVDFKSCMPEETFCSVVHIWYVVETVGKKENVNFSVNRTCTSECNPTCLVIGDRTKIHSCTSCCTESYCNTESSSSSKQKCSIPLMVSAFILALAPMLIVSMVPTLTKDHTHVKEVMDHTHVKEETKDHTHVKEVTEGHTHMKEVTEDHTHVKEETKSHTHVKEGMVLYCVSSASDVFLSTPWRIESLWRQKYSKMAVDQYSSRSNEIFLALLLFSGLSFFWLLDSASVSSKSFDNF